MGKGWHPSTAAFPTGAGRKLRKKSPAGKSNAFAAAEQPPA